MKPKIGYMKPIVGYLKSIIGYLKPIIGMKSDWKHIELMYVETKCNTLITLIYSNL